MLDLLLYSFISLPLSVTHCSSFSSSTSTSCCCRFSSSSTAAGSIYSQGPGSGILTPAGDSVKSRSFCCSCWRRWCPSADCACQANYDGGRIMFLRLPLPLRRLIGCAPANSHWIWKFRDFDFFFFNVSPLPVQSCPVWFSGSFYAQLLRTVPTCFTLCPELRWAPPGSRSPEVSPRLEVTRFPHSCLARRGWKPCPRSRLTPAL